MTVIRLVTIPLEQHDFDRLEAFAAACSKPVKDTARDLLVDLLADDLKAHSNSKEGVAS